MRYRPRKKKSDSPYRAPDPLIPPDIAMRVCLSCDEKFESQGKGNRICEKCNERQNRFDRTYRLSGGDAPAD